MAHGTTLAWLRAQKGDHTLGMHLPAGERFAHFCKMTRIIPDYAEQPHDEMCMEYEEMYPDFGMHVQRRKLYLCPRSTFKTSLSVAFIIWCLLRNPNIRILLVRATQEDATALLFEVKRKLSTNKVVLDVFGRVEDRAHTWSEKQINLGDLKEPTVGTAGLDVSKTGSHPDIVIVDDPVNETNFQSAKVMMQSRITVQSLSPILEKHGSIIVTGTRWAENDLYGWLIKEDDENEKLGLAREWLRYIRAARNPDGTLFFPSRLTEDYLKQQYNSDRKNGYKFYFSWFNNEPQVEGYRLFPPHLIRGFDATFFVDPWPTLSFADSTMIPVTVVITVDPANDPKQQNDFMGVSVVGFDYDANWWVLHSEAIKAVPSGQTAKVLYLIRHFGPEVCLIESGGVDIEFVARLQAAISEDDSIHTSIISYSALRDEARGMRGKTQRITALQPILMEERIKFRVDANSVLLQQMRDFPQVDHDDVIDSLAMVRAVARKCEFKTIGETAVSSEDQEEKDSWGPKFEKEPLKSYIPGTRVGYNTAPLVL